MRAGSLRGEYESSWQRAEESRSRRILFDNGSKVMKTWFVALVVAAALMIPGLALAGHGGSVLEFDELDGQLEHQRLELDYTVDRRSWRELRRRGITTRLNLYVEHDGRYDRSFAYSVELAHRKGTFTYPASVRVRNGDRIHFEVVGYAGAFRIEGLRYRGQRHSTVAFEIYDDCTNQPGTRRGRADRDHDDSRRRRHRGRDHHADRGDDYDHRDYRDHDDWNHDDHDHCVSDCPHCGRCDADRRRDRNRDAKVDIISACSDAVFSSRVDQCTEKANGLTSGNESATIQACDDAFIGDRDVLSCIDRSRGHYWSPAETIAACDDAFISSSSTLSCISKTRDSRSRPAPLVAACDSAVIGERDTLACIDKSRS